MPEHRPAPRLRWTTDPVTRQPIFVVPGDSVGSSSVVPRGKTWGIRERGDSPALRERLGLEPRLIPREYVCPVHGRFTRETDDETLLVRCESEPDFDFAGMSAAEACEVSNCLGSCGLPSPWSGSSCAIGIEPGMVTG